MMNHTILITLLFMLQSSNAETFYLKNGKKLIGTSKELDSKTLEIVSGGKGIRLYNKVKKSDILKVTREDVELKLFKEIEALEETPNLMLPEWYVEQFSKIETFKTEFPESFLFSKVRGIERALRKESAVIKEGGIKVNGELISAKEKIARAYDIDASIQAGKFKELYKERKLDLAINIVDKLEKEYYHSKAFSEIYIELPEFLKIYNSHLNIKRHLFKEREMKHNETLGKLTSTDLKNYKDTRKAQEMAFKERSMMNEKSGLRWRNVNPFEGESLDNLQQDLANYKLEVETNLVNYTPQNGGVIFSNAWSFIDSGEIVSAEALIKQLGDLKFNPLYLMRLEEYYEEERYKQREFQRRKKRGYETIPEDLYANVDTMILDAIIEVTGVVDSLEELNNNRLTDSAEQLELVRQTKITISVKAGRLERLLSYRDSLTGLEEKSLEILNIQFKEGKAVLLKGLDEAFSKIEEEYKQIIQSDIDAFKKAIL